MRAEFTKQTKRDALKRSGMKCEASGAMFGLDPGRHCETSLGNGVRFEHVDPDANSKDNSLENCLAVCPKCWRWKTDHYDKPLVSKTKRQQDKHLGIRTTSRPMPCGRNSDFKKTFSGEVVRR